VGFERALFLLLDVVVGFPEVAQVWLPIVHDHQSGHASDRDHHVSGHDHRELHGDGHDLSDRAPHVSGHDHRELHGDPATMNVSCLVYMYLHLRYPIFSLP